MLVRGPILGRQAGPNPHIASGPQIIGPHWPSRKVRVSLLVRYWFIDHAHMRDFYVSAMRQASSFSEQGSGLAENSLPQAFELGSGLEASLLPKQRFRQSGVARLLNTY